jgi:hypothetical protein
MARSGFIEKLMSTRKGAGQMRRDFTLNSLDRRLGFRKKAPESRSFYTIAPSCASDANSPVPKCATLRFRYKDDILATGIMVNGKRVITNIDTGSNSYFQLNPDGHRQAALAGRCGPRACEQLGRFQW